MDVSKLQVKIERPQSIRDNRAGESEEERQRFSLLEL